MNKFCKDCRFAKKAWYEFDFYDAKCYHPKAIYTHIDYVDGKVEVEADSCHSQRTTYGKCHPTGDLFEPISKTV